VGVEKAKLKAKGVEEGSQQIGQGETLTQSREAKE